mmetsp:Transcript_61547/g.144208  ORF Transcript_61547/g.144208 Transcript_61547/m.144208 type:complete len:226 (-) Transcript_61547:273-950(-)
MHRDRSVSKAWSLALAAEDRARAFRASRSLPRSPLDASLGAVGVIGKDGRSATVELSQSKSLTESLRIRSEKIVEARVGGSGWKELPVWSRRPWQSYKGSCRQGMPLEAFALSLTSRLSPRTCKARRVGAWRSPQPVRTDSRMVATVTLRRGGPPGRRALPRSLINLRAGLWESASLTPRLLTMFAEFSDNRRRGIWAASSTESSSPSTSPEVLRMRRGEADRSP